MLLEMWKLHVFIRWDVFAFCFLSRLHFPQSLHATAVVFQHVRITQPSSLLSSRSFKLSHDTVCYCTSSELAAQHYMTVACATGRDLSLRRVCTSMSCELHCADSDNVLFVVPGIREIAKQMWQCRSFKPSGTFQWQAIPQQTPFPSAASAASISLAAGMLEQVPMPADRISQSLCWPSRCFDRLSRFGSVVKRTLQVSTCMSSEVAACHCMTAANHCMINGEASESRPRCEKCMLSFTEMSFSFLQ